MITPKLSPLMQFKEQNQLKRRYKHHISLSRVVIIVVTCRRTFMINFSFYFSLFMEIYYFVCDLNTHVYSTDTTGNPNHRWAWYNNLY